MVVVAHGAVGDVAEPLDLGLGVAGHVGQDAVVGEQGVDRLGVSGDHGVAQERVEVSGRARRDLGGVGVRDLSAGTGQGSGFVGTATHRPRVRPDVEYVRDQELRRPGRDAGPQRAATGRMRRRLHEGGDLLPEGCAYWTSPRPPWSTPAPPPVTPGPRAVQASHDVEQPPAINTGSAATGNAKGPPNSSWLLGGPSRGGSAGIRTQGGYEPHRLSRSAPSAARTRYLAHEVTRTLPRSPTQRPAVSVTTDVVLGKP